MNREIVIAVLVLLGMISFYCVIGAMVYSDLGSKKKLKISLWQFLHPKHWWEKDD